MIIEGIYFTMNLEGYYTWVSPNIAKITKWKPKDIIGKHFMDICVKECHEEMLVNISKNIVGHTAVYYTRVYDKDGSEENVKIQVLRTPENIVGCIDRRLHDRE
jgi:PAS domain S-box-containing protein